MRKILSMQLHLELMLQKKPKYIWDYLNQQKHDKNNHSFKIGIFKSIKTNDKNKHSLRLGLFKSMKTMTKTNIRWNRKTKPNRTSLRTPSLWNRLPYKSDSPLIGIAAIREANCGYETKASASSSTSTHGVTALWSSIRVGVLTINFALLHQNPK